MKSEGKRGSSGIGSAGGYRLQLFIKFAGQVFQDLEWVSAEGAYDGLSMNELPSYR